MTFFFFERLLLALQYLFSLFSLLLVEPGGIKTTFPKFPQHSLKWPCDQVLACDFKVGACAHFLLPSCPLESCHGWSLDYEEPSIMS